jgi:hypothetical protein
VTNRAGWYIEDLTVNIQAVATNMWSPEIMGLNQTSFHALIAASLVLVLPLVIVATKRKRRK